MCSVFRKLCHFLSHFPYGQFQQREDEKKDEAEITMTASVLKQDPNTEKVQKNAIY